MLTVKLVLFFWLFVPALVSARDPFVIENKNVDYCNLSQLDPVDLIYAGTVQISSKKFAFVLDSYKHLCKLKVGDHLLNRYEVIDVLNDQVIYSDGHTFDFIK